MKILVFIICVLCCNVLDKIFTIIMSKIYARLCNYNCKNCKMWSCVNETDYDNENYYFGLFDNFKNVCGKDKENGNQKLP